MIKDQAALEIWMDRRAQLNRARAISAQAQARLDRSRGSANLDWIDSHRPKGSGMSFNHDGAYISIGEPRYIPYGSAGR